MELFGKKKHWRYIIIRNENGHPIEFTCRCKPKRVYTLNMDGNCPDCESKYFPNQEREVYYQ